MWLLLHKQVNTWINNNKKQTFCLTGFVPGCKLSNGACSIGGWIRRDGPVSEGLYRVWEASIFLLLRCRWAWLSLFVAPCVFSWLHISWSVNPLLCLLVCSHLFMPPLLLPPECHHFMVPRVGVNVWWLESRPLWAGRILIWSCLLSFRCPIDVSTPLLRIFKPIYLSLVCVCSCECVLYTHPLLMCAEGRFVSWPTIPCRPLPNEVLMKGINALTFIARWPSVFGFVSVSAELEQNTIETVSSLDSRVEILAHSTV